MFQPYDTLWFSSIASLTTGTTLIRLRNRSVFLRYYNPILAVKDPDYLKMGGNGTVSLHHPYTSGCSGVPLAVIVISVSSNTVPGSRQVLSVIISCTRKNKIINLVASGGSSPPLAIVLLKLILLQLPLKYPQRWVDL